MTALLAKATALALVQHPVVNSSCRDGKSFTYNSHINVAVAVAIDGGLITPVLQDADKVDNPLSLIKFPVEMFVGCPSFTSLTLLCPPLFVLDRYLFIIEKVEGIG